MSVEGDDFVENAAHAVEMSVTITAILTLLQWTIHINFHAVGTTFILG